MYLELLGDIVSILYCVYSSHSVLKSVLFFFLFLRFLQLYTVLKTDNTAEILLIDGGPSTTRAFFLIVTAPPSSSGAWLK